MEINGFTIDEYNIYGIKEGTTASTCPKCSESRRKKKDKCMSVFWDTGIGHCNHCGERIQLHTYKKETTSKSYVKPIDNNKFEYSNALIKYAKEQRGVSESTLKHLKISEGVEWMPKAKGKINCIKFNYYLNNELINIKYRARNKDFKLHKDSEKIFYNLDSVRTEKECVIVEGEWDVCSFVEAGYYSVVSVPNGFNLKGDHINLDYLDNYYHYFENKDKIYLAVDNDEAGEKGHAELVRRLGAEKCYTVNFGDCKDADEYSTKYGNEKLIQLLDKAEQVPLEYVETIYDFEDELDDFYINGCPKGYMSGMRDLDEIYSTELGQYTIITGAPQSGKSEFLDAMCIGMSLLYGFKTAFASPENKPNKFHSDKILRKIAGYKPRNREDLGTLRVKRTKEFMAKNFYHVEFDDGYELTRVLSKFEELVKRKGVRVFVLDPFNKIKLKSSLHKNVNDYTSDYLNLIDVFCKKHQCIIFLVAHPIKMNKEDGTDTYMMPTAYNIKGGGEMFDMAYHIIGLVKDIERKVVKCKTLKVKFQHLGEPERTVYFGWNVNNGRYTDIDFDVENHMEGEIIWDNSDWLNGACYKDNHIESQKPKKEISESEYINQKIKPIENIKDAFESPVIEKVAFPGDIDDFEDLFPF